MADLRPATLRNVTSGAPTRVLPEVRPELRPAVQPQPEIQDRVVRDSATRHSDPTVSLIATFAEPSAKTSSWLSDPRIIATLEAASTSLAPGGATANATDRYAASVIETHLVARRRLTKLTNALLKT